MEYFFEKILWDSLKESMGGLLKESFEIFFFGGYNRKKSEKIK